MRAVNGEDMIRRRETGRTTPPCLGLTCPAGYRHPPALSKVFIDHLKSESGLNPLEFSVLDQGYDPVHHRFVQSGSKQIRPGLVIIDITLEDFIQQGIRRQAILIGLTGPELCRRRLLNDARGNDRFAGGGVEPFRNPVDHCLGQVGDDGQTPGHIAIDGAVAHGEL